MNSVFFIGKDTIPANIRLGEGQRLSITLVCLPGFAADVPMEVELCGEGASLDVKCVYVACEGDSLKFDFKVRHTCPGAVSNQIFKGIASGKSFVSFDGLVYVAPDAVRTEAYQASHTILLSEDSCVETRPQLEIYADDVKCSHGATTGYLNLEEQFYMRSRGISGEEARRLQIMSFLAPVVSDLSEETKQRIYESIP